MQVRISPLPVLPPLPATAAIPADRQGSGVKEEVSRAISALLQPGTVVAGKFPLHALALELTGTLSSPPS